MRKDMGRVQAGSGMVSPGTNVAWACRIACANEQCKRAMIPGLHSGSNEQNQHTAIHSHPPQPPTLPSNPPNPTHAHTDSTSWVMRSSSWRKFVAESGWVCTASVGARVAGLKSAVRMASIGTTSSGASVNRGLPW